MRYLRRFLPILLVVISLFGCSRITVQKYSTPEPAAGTQEISLTPESPEPAAGTGDISPTPQTTHPTDPTPGEIENDESEIRLPDENLEAIIRETTGKGENENENDELEIYFPDKNLEALIREITGEKDGAIKIGDIKDISNIFARAKGIKSLEGLQHFKNLTSINLSYNQIEDITPLTELTQLNIINLNNNAKEEFDVSVFSGYKQLTLYFNKRVYMFPSEKSMPAKPAPIPEKYSSMDTDFLVLLDNEGLIESMDDFYAFKKSQGYKISIELVGNIPEKNKNRTDDIRNYLKEMEKAHDLKYVLIIGDPYNAYNLKTDNTGGNIPMKYFYQVEDDSRATYDGSSIVYIPEEKYFVNTVNYPTDLYYAFDIDWNRDNDEYTGEAAGIDYRSDDLRKIKPLFSLGRIPFSDKESVQLVLNNSINAQKKYINEPAKSLKALIAAPMLGFIETELSAKIKNRYYLDRSRDGEIIRINLQKAGIQTATLYEKEGITYSPFDCTYPLNIRNFMNEFKKGYDMVFSNGHGGIERRIFTIDKNSNGYIDQDDIVDAEEYWDGLEVERARNTFTFLDACSTGLTEGVPAMKGSCKIASLMKAEATICGVGSTRDSGTSPQFDYDCISIMFMNDSQIDSFGNLFYDAVVKRITDVLNQQSGDSLGTVFIFNYFGDPSLNCKPGL